MHLGYLTAIIAEEDTHNFRNAPEIEGMLDAYDELLQNGMFRNREHNGIPISGSNADFTYDTEDYEYFAEILGMAVVV